MWLAAEGVKNTHPFTHKHDSSLAQTWGGLPGAWVASNRKWKKDSCVQQGVSDPHPEERRPRSQDGCVSHASPYGL